MDTDPATRTDPAGAGTKALDEPRTGRRFRAERARAAGLVAIGIALLAAAAVLGRVAGAGEAALVRDGIPTTATVVALAPATLLDSGHVTVEYEAQGATHRTSLPVNLELEPVEPGARLRLLVDPEDPGRVHAPDVGGRPSSVGFPIVVGLLVGAALTTVGAVVARRCRRWGRILRAHAWERRRFRYGNTPGAGARAVLRLEDPGGGTPRDVGVIRAPRWALRHLQVRGTGELVIAGPADGEQVVAPLSRLELFGVRPPRGAREASRWRDALGGQPRNPDV